MSIVASVIAPTAPVAASVPRAPVARHVPLPSQKVARGPAHRGLVVARGGEISWDEADEILTLECVPNVAASYPRCVRLPRRIIARPAPDLSVRFRFRNPSVTNLKTRLTLGTPLPCSLGGEHADIQVDVKDKWTAEVMVKAPDRPGLLNDVCAALNDNNLHVVGAEITTVEGKGSNKFVVRLPEECPVTFGEGDSFFDDEGELCGTMMAKVRAVVVEAALNSWSEGAVAKKPQYIPPEESKVEAKVTATVVETSLTKTGQCVVISMEATDRKGLLNAITSALRKLNCEVLSGSVATKDGIANNRLVIAAPSNMKSEKIRLAVEALVK